MPNEAKTLVIVHQKKVMWATQCFKLASAVCNVSGVRLVVISDEANRETVTSLGIEFHSISDYDYCLNYGYIHRSVQPEDHEKFCIDRWFILLEFLKQQGLERCFHLDSDVLLMCPDYFDQFNGEFDFIGFDGLIVSPGTVCVNQAALEGFKKTIQEFYRSPEQFKVYFQAILQRLNTSREHISDMYLWGDVFSANPVIPQDYPAVSIRPLEYSLPFHKSLVQFLPVTFEYSNGKWYAHGTHQQLFYLHCAGAMKSVVPLASDLILTKQSFRIETPAQFKFHIFPVKL